MPTYYVRKSGSDSNDGLSPGAAKLTVQAAVTLAVAGDVIHVGAGVYRELVTLGSSGSSGSPIQLRGDVTGDQTGDAGLVIVSAANDEVTIPARNGCLNLDGRTWWTFSGITMTGALNTNFAPLYDTPVSAARSFEGIVIEDCAILAVGTNDCNSMLLHVNQGSAPTSQGLRVRRSLLMGFRAIDIRHTNNGTAHVDMDMRFENCVLWGASGNSSIGIRILHSGSTSTHSITNIIALNCTVVAAREAFLVGNLHDTATPSFQALNCLIHRTGFYLDRAGGTAGSVFADYITTEGGSNFQGSVGSNILTTGHVLGMGGILDWTLYRFWGWSPFLPWEPIRLPEDDYANAAIGYANASGAPAVDGYGNSRPMGRSGSFDTGAVEAHRLPRQETTTVHDGSNAIRFNGGGYHDVFIPVAASAKTITVQARVDANYSGSAPILEVLNIPGVADQSDVHSGTADTWEELSCSFTPAIASVVRVRIRSRDVSASGLAFFDTLDVS